MLLLTSLLREVLGSTNKLKLDPLDTEAHKGNANTRPPVSAGLLSFGYEKQLRHLLFY